MADRDPNRPSIEPGARFGRLVIRSVLPTGRVECDCDCGTTKTLRRADVLQGRTRSCGCLLREVSTARVYRHGGKALPEYSVWQAMKNRCLYASNKHYTNYGGRGITVCDQWLNSFESFFADMGQRPSSKHSIERRDNSRGYSPDNCYWATRVEQNRNRRDTVRITYQGETLSLADWADRLRRPYALLRKRIYHGWSVDRAFTEPLGLSSKRTGLSGESKLEYRRRYAREWHAQLKGKKRTQGE